MNKDDVSIDYYGINVRSAFGCQHVEVTYIMTHVKYERVNRYKVTCEISGIQVHDLELIPSSAEFLGNMEKDSNDETLTEYAAMQLFEDSM